MRGYTVVIHGPTGVGKSDLAVQIAHKLEGAVIVNADLGQFYTPLTIGTAKPAWQQEPVPHLLFDILDEPVNFSVFAYRQKLRETLEPLWRAGKVPIIVGGSGFYVKAFFFQLPETTHVPFPLPTGTQVSWDTLYMSDPARAERIHPHDTYRIERALAIMAHTGSQASEYQELYDPLSAFTFLSVERDRPELYSGINARTQVMMDQGWLAETAALVGTAWQPFVHQKGLIGYTELGVYLEKGPDGEPLDQVLDRIRQKTRAYAKRQMTYGRMLRRVLEENIHRSSGCAAAGKVVLLNLTHDDLAEYIEHLSLDIAAISHQSE